MRTAVDPAPKTFGAEHVSGWRTLPLGHGVVRARHMEKPREAHFFSTVFHRRSEATSSACANSSPISSSSASTLLSQSVVMGPPCTSTTPPATTTSTHPRPDRNGDLAPLAAACETEDPATWIDPPPNADFLGLVARCPRPRHAPHPRRRPKPLRHPLLRLLELNKRPASRYADWYRIENWHDDGTFDYAGWGGHGGLPEFGRTGDTLHPGIKQYLFDITRRWMDPSGQGRPEEGIDGWRLDVAYCVPHGFWREWHAHVRSINPDAYTTGEIVGPAQAWIRPDEFSAVMNYEWTYPTIAFFTTHSAAIGAAEFRRRIDVLHARHSPGTALIMQNLLDSHDTGRILTLLESACPPFAHWDDYFNWPKAADNPDLKTHRPGPDAKQALKLAAVWQFAGPGAPMLYYGTEVGLWGANDP
jgi:hypothetical protein